MFNILNIKGLQHYYYFKLLGTDLEFNYSNGV